MTYLFISDLHLSEKHPRLIRGFLDLLADYANQQTQLYILGDWFNAWLGDDDQAAWLDPIIVALQHFNAQGNTIYFQAGNRDFALGEKFLQQFNAVLLPEIAYINIAGTRFRLEHGDALCTDDVGYQRFKKFIRHPLILTLLKKSPLALRQKLANGFRKQSQVAQQQKSTEIMDVNAHAVQLALQHCDILIHGHTHRPAIHQLGHQFRLVLGDWRETTLTAEILEIDEQANWQMRNIKFSD